MAASMVWRKGLNEHNIFKVLREKKHKLKQPRDCTDCLTIRDGQIYLWNAYNSNVLTTNLKSLIQDNHRATYQTLLCTNAPVSEIDTLLLNPTGSFLALLGPKAAYVIQIPERWGKYAEFEGGKEKINCKTYPVAERLFTTNEKVCLRHAAWHPGSPTGTHIVLLTSDNCLRMYDILDPQNPTETYPLSDTGASYPQSGNCSFMSAAALGEVAVSFDFGPPMKIPPRVIPGGTPRSEEKVKLQWPIFILQGDGDVFLLQTQFDLIGPMKTKLQGPLKMSPPAEVNYGLESCSVMCLASEPPVLVIAESNGNLHHCVILNHTGEDNDDENSVTSWNRDDNTRETQMPSLYVYESVELELSLTTVAVETEEAVLPEFSCPMKLHKDPGSIGRYHCSHSAGVHSIVLPWIHKFESFCKDDQVGDVEQFLKLGEEQQAIVEHNVCTKPLQSSPPSPILGISVTADPLLGATLVVLTATLECLALPLLAGYKTTPQHLLADSESKKLASPLKIYKQPFDEVIKKTLQRNVSNPAVIRGSANTELSPKECFQLLSRATQVFREEYLQKQDLAREEIERRMRVLQEQKVELIKDLSHAQQSRNILRDNAETLAEKLEEARERQIDIADRIEILLKKLQERMPMLSDAEREVAKELKMMQEKVDIYKKQIHNVKEKRDYQSKQIAASSRRSQKIGGALPSNQVKTLRTMLKREGDDIASLVKDINDLKLTLDV